MQQQEVQLKRLFTRKPVQKQILVGEPVHEDPEKVVGAARI